MNEEKWNQIKKEVTSEAVKNLKEELKESERISQEKRDADPFYQKLKKYRK